MSLEMTKYFLGFFLGFLGSFDSLNSLRMNGPALVRREWVAQNSISSPERQESSPTEIKRLGL